MTVRQFLIACTNAYTDVAIFTEDNEPIPEKVNLITNILTNPFYEYILTAKVVAWFMGDNKLYIRTDYTFA